MNAPSWGPSIDDEAVKGPFFGRTRKAVLTPSLSHLLVFSRPRVGFREWFHLYLNEKPVTFPWGWGETP